MVQIFNGANFFPKNLVHWHTSGEVCQFQSVSQFLYNFSKIEKWPNTAWSPAPCMLSLGWIILLAGYTVILRGVVLHVRRVNYYNFQQIQKCLNTARSLARNNFVFAGESLPWIKKNIYMNYNQYSPTFVIAFQVASLTANFSTLYEDNSIIL